MADYDKDANDTESGQRDRERELHRAQLDAVRSAFEARGEPAPEPLPDDPTDADRTEYLLARLRADLRQLDRRQRNTGRIALALAVAVVVGAVALIQQAFLPLEQPGTVGEIRALSIRADRIAVTRDLRVLDAAGNELAVLGRDLGPTASGSGERPVVLALNAENDPSRQLLRLAASNSGAGLTLEAPTGSSSVSLLTSKAGSTVEVRNGGRTQRFSGERSELPPVAAGPKPSDTPTSRASEVPVSISRRAGPPNGEVPELREVGHGFLVADLSALPAAEGVEVRGRMVNTTAVVHSGLAFKITLGGASATLTVPKISPGNSTGFRITLPGVAADQAGDAQVEYLGSTVAFQATSTEPIYGRQVEPN